ncbi:unnamed protein product [Protopolystoma xenopodis]|uniref:Uncharacterized protein n=1 Tax=Protopolystoma xenopodis TaxID=117903 RepID=A0A3S5A9N7_9PLAT|nr:unnamed protein product [Protopolystoma xenopodis]
MAKLEFPNREKDNLEARLINFTSNGEIYEQFGLLIESPLLPHLTDVYMKKLEEDVKTPPLQPEVLMQRSDGYFALWAN